MQQQPSAQGIASLYMGNPGALQQRVQKEQQAKPGLPPDLGKLMALNIVTNEQDAAKRQQALNAVQQAVGPAGQMPTVAQSIQEQAKQKLQAQMLQQQRQQAGLQALAQQNPSQTVPESTPQPESQPGIDELPVELGLAGGGIVAFAGGEDVPKYETPYDRRNRLIREQEAKDRVYADESGMPDFMAADGEYYAKPLEADARAQSPRLQQLAQWAGRNVERDPETGEVIRKAEPRVVSEQPAGSPELPRGIAGARRYPAAAEAPQKVIGAPAGLPAAAATPPRVTTPAANPARVTAPAAGNAAQQGLGALLEKGIREDLGRDREAEAKRLSDQYAQTAGYDQYAKQLQDILGTRQKAVEEAKASRTPEWVKGLQALSGAPVRGGLGMMLGQAGAAATKAREAYGEEDMKYTQEMDKLRDAAARAQLEGNTGKAKIYMDAYKEVDTARRNALTSGTSLENTRETAAARKQMAADAAAGRAEARTEKADEAMRQKAMALAMAAAQKEKALPANMVKYRDVPTEQLAAAMYDRIYNALKTGKMVEAPGATGPGGSTPPPGAVREVKR